MHTRFNQTDIIKNNYVASCFNPPDFIHSHDFFELSFCLHGKTVNVINDIPYDFERGSCVILRPSDRHYFIQSDTISPKSYEHKDVYVTQENLRTLCLSLHPELYDAIIRKQEPLIFPIDENFLKYIDNQSLLLAEAMSNGKEYFTAIHASIVTAIVVKWLQGEELKTTKYPLWLERLLPKFNSADFLSLTVTEIAKTTDYTPPYFSSEFKKIMGVTAVSYLIKKRLEFSIELLADDRMKIIDISLILGFANPSTYSQHFLNEYGITPTAYRKKILGIK